MPTRIYKVTSPSIVEPIMVLVEASTPSAALRAVAETLLSVSVANGKDVLAAIHDGAHVMPHPDPDPDTLPLPLDGPTPDEQVAAFDTIAADAIAAAAPRGSRENPIPADEIIPPLASLKTRRKSNPPAAASE